METPPSPYVVKADTSKRASKNAIECGFLYRSKLSLVADILGALGGRFPREVHFLQVIFIIFKKITFRLVSTLQYYLFFVINL